MCPLRLFGLLRIVQLLGEALRGKAISLADGFYWIDADDAGRFARKKPVRVALIATENLLAVRQACDMLELEPGQVEDLFYGNALRLLNER